MLGEILPAGAVAVETYVDAEDHVLAPEEEAAVSRAVDRRRREFTTGRSCAKLAQEHLGLHPRPIPSGPRGEPLWPRGIVGSITHCTGYRACALAYAQALAGLGIDAEPHEALPRGVLALVAGEPERRRLEAMTGQEPYVHWDRLLFCAKEAVYKAWFPIARRQLAFCDAAVSIEPARRAFRARLVRGPLIDGNEVVEVEGRWLVRNRLVVTSVAIPRPTVSLAYAELSCAPA